MSERLRKVAVPAFAGAVGILLPAVALAQDDTVGRLLKNRFTVFGLAVAVVVVIAVVLAMLVKSRRKKPVETKRAGSESTVSRRRKEIWMKAAEAQPEKEPQATVFSAMGLMSNVNGPLNGDYFIIKQTGLTIGRDPETCDILYDDPTVSRQHTRLEYTKDGLVVRNLSDTNQTFHNDQSVTEALVKAGDRIRIENVTFKVLPHGASE